MKFRLIIDKTKDEEVVATVHGRCALTDQIEALVAGRAETDAVAAYIEDEMRMLPFSHIECIRVEGGKTWAMDIRGRQYRLKHRLYELEEILPSCFIRINKSSLANEHRLDRFAATYSGGVDAVFGSGFREYVSRRCFAEIKRRFKSK